jgi:hypothetical protein
MNPLRAHVVAFCAGFMLPLSGLAQSWSWEPCATGGYERGCQSGHVRWTTGFTSFEEGNVRTKTELEICWTASEFVWHRMDASAWERLAEERGKNWMWKVPTETATQSFETRGRVQAAAVLGDDALAVARLDDLDRLVLEVWRFRWPDAMPEPDPKTHVVPVVEPERVEVREVLVVSAAQLAIREMIELRRKDDRPRAVLALCTDTPELVTIDLETGLVDPLASGASHAGSLGFVPPLAETRFDGFSVHDDAAEGFVYFLTPRTGCVIDTTWPALRLVDRDRDGRIDGWHRSTLGEMWAPVSR